MTYWSAVVDESDRCFLGGVPGDGLREVFGVWEEESQSYFPHESVTVRIEPGNLLGMDGAYRAVDTCSVIHAEGSAVLATYGSDYFAGSPALTAHTFGKGTGYYIASRNEPSFLGAFYRALIGELALERVLQVDLPAGVTAQMRTDGQQRFIFLMNVNDHPAQVPLDDNYTDLLTGSRVDSSLTLQRYGVAVLTPR